MIDDLSLEDIEPYLNQMDVFQLEELFASLADLEEQPVHINEFLDSDKFLGKYFDGGLYPYWRKVLGEIYPSPFYDPYWLISFRGSIGQGKTSIATAGVLYDLYKLLCMKNPQKSFGLVPSTKILFAIFNVTLSLATDVVWDKITNMFAVSPFFSKFLGPLNTKRKDRDTLFPKHIDFFMGSRIGHTLGKAVYTGIMDESNFEVIHGQVYETFNSLLRRLESRFMKVGGGVAGKLWVVSSETDKFSTVNKIIESYKNKSGVYISGAALWDVKNTRPDGSPIYSGKKFWVFIGSDTRQPTLIEAGDPTRVKEPEHCIEVPVEHLDSFEADINASLRDLAGKPTVSSYKLFRLRDRLAKAMTIVPLFPETIQLDFDDDFDQISNYITLKNYFKEPLNRHLPRYIHIDIGLIGDRLGIAGSYVSSYSDRISRDITTFQEIKENIPNLVNEWSFALEPKAGKQIPLYKVRVFIQWLQKNNYLIAKVTCDGFQSSDMIQLLQKMRIEAELLSMDRTNTPYLVFRNLVYEGRALIAKSFILKRECEELEVSPDGQKIDHPEKNADGTRGSKDISDAVGGSLYNADLNSHKTKIMHLVQGNDHRSPVGSELRGMFWPGDKN